MILMTYKGRSETIKAPTIAVIIICAIIFCLFTFFTPGIGTYIATVILLLIMNFAYKGIILRITIDDTKIIIVRPVSRNVIKLNDIAFCAVHGIDDDRSLIYAFVRQKLGRLDSVKGVKPRKSFDEIVAMVFEEDSKVDLDVNFNKAAKIPVSFVEDGEKLKDKILEIVSVNQMEIIKNR